MIISPNPKFTAYDNSGDPLNGGLLYTYQAGTTTPLATYTDYAGGTANSNPVVLDSAGRADVWLASGYEYKMVLKNSSGTTIWTVDNIVGSGTSITFAATIAALRLLQAGEADYVITAGYYSAGDGGNSMYRWSSSSSAADDGGITITPSSAPASGRWLLVHNDEITAKQYGAKGDNSTNDYTAFYNANAGLSSSGGTLIVTEGAYVIGSNLTFSSGVDVQMNPGSSFTASAAKVIYFTGKFSAPEDQVFGSNIRAKFATGTAPKIRAAWFGVSNTAIVGQFSATAQTKDISGGSVERVDGSSLSEEILSETNFTTHAYWAPTGDFTDSTGAAVYTHSTGAGALFQTSGGFTDDANVSIQPNKWYVFVYDLSAVSGDVAFVLSGGGADLFLVDTPLDMTAGTDKKVLVKSNTSVSGVGFNIEATSTSGGATLDNVSLKEVRGGSVHVMGYLGGGGDGPMIAGNGKLEMGDNYIGSGTSQASANKTKGLSFDTSEFGTFSEGIEVVTKLVIPHTTAEPTGAEGFLWLDTDAGANGTLKIYSNGGWRTVAAL
jgi:hypothetical protein